MTDLALVLLTVLVTASLAALVTAVDRRWPTDPVPAVPPAADPAGSTARDAR